MDFLEYENSAARTINPELGANERLIDAAAGLAEEAGEALSLVRKHLYQGKELDRAKLEKELGDALWCLAMTPRAAGLSPATLPPLTIPQFELPHPHRLPSLF